MKPAAKKALTIAAHFVAVFVLAFVGQYLLAGFSIDTFRRFDLLIKAANSGIAAVGVAVASALGLSVGNKQTPTLLPAKLDPATKTYTVDVSADPVPEPDTPMRAGYVDGDTAAALAAVQDAPDAAHRDAHGRFVKKADK